MHHTHPDGINVLAGTADGERLVAECFGDEAAWIPYIRPGFTLSKQVGEAVRDNPGLKLVVLAKHGLVVWGDTAEEAYTRRSRSSTRPSTFVNAKTRQGALRRRARRAPEVDRDALLRDLLPAIRGAVSSERPKVLTVDTSPRVLEFVSLARSADADRQVGAACPDHLVHTKRVPLWVPFDPGRRTRRSGSGSRARRRATATTTAPTSTSTPTRATVPGDPDARVVLIQHVGLVGVGADDEERVAVARPLPPRDRGHGRAPRRSASSSR